MSYELEGKPPLDSYFGETFTEGKMSEPFFLFLTPKGIIKNGKPLKLDINERVLS